MALEPPYTIFFVTVPSIIGSSSPYHFLFDKFLYSCYDEGQSDRKLLSLKLEWVFVKSSSGVQPLLFCIHSEIGRKINP